MEKKRSMRLSPLLTITGRVSWQTETERWRKAERGRNRKSNISQRWLIIIQPWITFTFFKRSKRSEKREELFKQQCSFLISHLLKQLDMIVDTFGFLAEENVWPERASLRPTGTAPRSLCCTLPLIFSSGFAESSCDNLLRSYHWSKIVPSSNQS